MRFSIYFICSMMFGAISRQAWGPHWASPNSLKTEVIFWSSQLLGIFLQVNGSTMGIAQVFPYFAMENMGKIWGTYGKIAHVDDKHYDLANLNSVIFQFAMLNNQRLNRLVLPREHEEFSGKRWFGKSDLKTVGFYSQSGWVFLQVFPEKK